MRYLLDTNTCIFAMKQHPVVRARLASKRPSEIGISVVTEAELRLGAAKSQAPAKTLRTLTTFLQPLQILELASSDALTYATVRAALERAGTPIGPLDTFIAAHAVARQLVLVTNNVREFNRVAGLAVEDWTI